MIRGWRFVRVLFLGVGGVVLAGFVPAHGLRLETADGLAVELSARGEVVSVALDGVEVTRAPAPLLRLRDLSVAGSIFEPNRLGNPGFEDGLAGWHEVDGEGVDGVLASEVTHGGTAALELSGGSQEESGWAMWAAGPVEVRAGERVRLGAWWQSPTGYLAEGRGTAPALQMEQWRTLQHRTGLYVQWLDASGHPVGLRQLAVALHTNCASWKLTRRELTVPEGVAAVRVMVGAKLLGETVRVDDVSLVSAAEDLSPVAGSVTPCEPAGACLELVAVTPGHLELWARLIAQDEVIRIDGTVTDTSGTERALDLVVAIPLAADDGWRWWDDAHSSRSIVRGTVYEHVISAVGDGWLPISLYPYGGMGSNARGLGLALGLPPEGPQLGEIAFDAAGQLFEVTFHLGISPAALQLEGRASFHAVLFRVDPDWGFRSIIERFHGMDPDVYKNHVWLYDYRGGSQGDYSSPPGVQQTLDEDAAGIYTAEYTSSDLPFRVTPSNQPRPTLEDLLLKVDQMAGSPEERVRSAAEAIRSSAIVDTNADWWLKQVVVPVWDRDWWEGCWIANMDPEIEGGKAQWNIRYPIDPAFEATEAAGAHLDGVQIDNFMATAVFDLRPEALAAASRTLGYSPLTYQPAVHNGFAEHEYMAWLRQHLDAAWGADRAITVNLWGLGHPFYLAPFIDGFGSEGNIEPSGTGGNWTLEILDYRRAIAYHRPCTFANQTPGLTPELARLVAGPAILFGVVVSHGPNGAGWDPEAEAIMQAAADLVRRFGAAGWEPLTHARAASPEVLMERFGRAGPPIDPSSPRGVFFTVYNNSDTGRDVAVTVDLAALGLTSASTLRVTDLATSVPVAFTVAGTSLEIDLALGPRQSRVLHVISASSPRWRGRPERRVPRSQGRSTYSGL